jgi:hypothetical protein
MRHTALLAGVAWLAVTAVAHAAPFASVATLDPGARSRFESAIVTAKARDNHPFTTVASIVAHADALDHEKRGRFYPMTSLLRGSTRGQATAALALLEPVIAPERFTMPQSESARIALRAGLIEAAGDKKEPLAAPIYHAIIDTSAEYYEIRAAVEALGKLGQDADIAYLARLATTAGTKQEAIVDGMGDCRRVAAAQALDAVVRQRPTGMFGKHLLRALARMGSAWVLATPNAVPAAEVATLRDTTARAAFAMFLQAPDADLRAEASDALIVIAAPDTPTWITAAKGGAAPDLVAALDTLAARLAHNPTTTRTVTP